MNFNNLLEIAQVNKQNKPNQKGFSTAVAPAKKPPRSNVPSDAIKKFLEKREAVEKQKEVEARKQKDKLLNLRAQNSKSNKAAKLMSSRTKDNDFSKIRLTEDEVENKQKMEAQLIRQRLTDKVERMKARIKIQEQQDAIPHKRKRKSKVGQPLEVDAVKQPEAIPEKRPKLEENWTSVKPKQENKKFKSSKAPTGPLSFNELLKIAAEKQKNPNQESDEEESSEEEQEEATRLTSKRDDQYRVSANRVSGKYRESKSDSRQQGLKRPTERNGKSNLPQSRQTPSNGMRNLNNSRPSPQSNSHSTRSADQPMNSRSSNSTNSRASQQFNSRPSNVKSSNQSSSRPSNQNSSKQLNSRPSNQISSNTSQSNGRSLQQNSLKTQNPINSKVSNESKSRQYSQLNMRPDKSSISKSNREPKSSQHGSRSSYDRNLKSSNGLSKSGNHQGSLKEKDDYRSIPSYTTQSKMRPSSSNQNYLAKSGKGGVTAANRNDSKNGLLNSSKVNKSSLSNSRNMSQSDLQNVPSYTTKKVVRNDSRPKVTSARFQDVDIFDEENCLLNNTKQMEGRGVALQKPNLFDKTNGRLNATSLNRSVNSSQNELRGKQQSRDDRTINARESSSMSRDQGSASNRSAMGGRFQSAGSLQSIREREMIERRMGPPSGSGINHPRPPPRRPSPSTLSQRAGPMRHDPYLPSRGLARNPYRKLPPITCSRPARRIESDDDEDDEDMREFIDDGPLNDVEDYSKHIQEIFGYDKNKYLFEEEFDDEAMESSYAEQMKEELRSARLGLLEDLEDIRKEAEEMKRKQKKKANVT